MRIAIVGGHGKVASHLAPILVERGHDVTSIVRNPAHADDISAGGAVPVVLDVESASEEQVSAALDGFDAVVWSAGAGGGDAARTYAVDRDAAIRTMDAAQSAGVRRFVMVSWIGSAPDHGVPPDSTFFPYADAKLAADDHLRGSGLAWTILGPGTLTDDPPTGRITTAPAGSGEVSRADVAAVVAAVLADDRTIGRFIRFGAGDRSIAAALGGDGAASE